MGLKVALCGPSRSGKDCIAEWLAAHTTLRYGPSTSQVIVPHAATRLGMAADELFRRRSEFRPFLFDVGRELCRDDPAFLVRRTLDGGDIVVGVRDRAEMECVVRERLVDLSVWVDRPGVPHDPTIRYGPELCDVVLPNHWGLPELHGRLVNLARSWGVVTGQCGHFGPNPSETR